MKTDDIKILIEAFYNGKTTIEEEKMLMDYFASGCVPEELSDEKEFFLQLHKSDDIEIPVHLESNLDKLIDKLAEQENKPKRSNKRRALIWISGIAASIAILFSVAQHYRQSYTNKDTNASRTLKDTYSDPTQASKEAQKALALVSTNFNKGVEQLEVASDNINMTSKIINKSFQHIK